VAWCSMANPCSGVFIPVPIGSPLPEPLMNGTDESSPWSVWWSMRELQRVVDANREALTPVFRLCGNPGAGALREVVDNPSTVASDIWKGLLAVQDMHMVLADRLVPSRGVRADRSATCLVFGHGRTSRPRATPQKTGGGPPQRSEVRSH